MSNEENTQETEGEDNKGVTEQDDKSVVDGPVEAATAQAGAAAAEEDPYDGVVMDEATKMHFRIFYDALIKSGQIPKTRDLPECLR